MTFRIETRDSVAGVSAEAWGALEGADLLYVAHPFALVAESDPNFECRYLLAWDDERLIAAIPAYRARRDPGAAYDPQRLLLDEEGDPGPPALLLGARGGFANRLLLAPDLDGASRDLLIDEIAAAVDDLAAAWGTARIAALYCDDRSARDALRLLGPDACSYWVTAGVSIHGGPTSLDSYLEGLPPSRRGLVRRERRKFEAAGYEISAAPIELEQITEAVPLLAATNRKHGGGLDEEFFLGRLAAQKEELGDALRWISCRREGTLVGCLTYTLWENTLYAQQVGLRYAATGEAAEYFNLVVHLPLAEAIEAGCDVLDLSTEGWRAKVLRGGRLASRWAVVRGLGSGERASEVERIRIDGFRADTEGLGVETTSRAGGVTAGGG